MRRRVRRSQPRNIVQSFKKVLNAAPGSRAADTLIAFTAVTGTDSVAAGQTGVIDSAVPTGSIVEFIEFQLGMVNLISVSCFIHVAIEQTHSGQSVVDPRVVGGDPQRNQVFHQQMFTIGQNQNSNHIFRFKVPRKFQRVREGDTWQLVTVGDVVHTSACQTIYKFKR